MDPKTVLNSPVFPFLLNDARQQSLVSKGDFCPLYRIRYAFMHVCIYVRMYSLIALCITVCILTTYKFINARCFKDKILSLRMSVYVVHFFI